MVIATCNIEPYSYIQINRISVFAKKSDLDGSDKWVTFHYTIQMITSPSDVMYNNHNKTQSYRYI